MLADFMSQPSVLDRKGFIKAGPGSEWTTANLDLAGLEK